MQLYLGHRAPLNKFRELASLTMLTSDECAVSGQDEPDGVQNHKFLKIGGPCLFPDFEGTPKATRTFSLPENTHLPGTLWYFVVPGASHFLSSARNLL